ncbi:MAG: hypothetical protein U1E39_11680 [Planctomycetota bacterium]
MRLATAFLSGALLGVGAGAVAARVVGFGERKVTPVDLLAEIPAPEDALSARAPRRRAPMPRHAETLLEAVAVGRPGDGGAYARATASLAELAAIGGDEASFVRLAIDALARGVPIDQLLPGVREFPSARQGPILAQLLDAAPAAAGRSVAVAQLLAATGERERALALVRGALPLEPGFHAEFARLLLRLDPDGAAATLLGLESSSTWDADDLEALRALFVEAGTEAALIPFLDRALAERPDDHATLRMLRGVDPAAARTRADDLVRRNPSDPWAWSFLGELRRQAGDNPGAFEAFRTAAERAPSRSTFRELMRLDPERGLALVLGWTDGTSDDEMLGARAEAYALAGRNGDAVQAYLLAHAHDPNDGEWIAKLTALDATAAVTVLEQRIGGDPGAASAKWLGRYARALEGARRNEDAFAQYLAAHKKAPADGEWMRSLVRLDPARALPVLEAHVKGHPADSAGQGALGLALAAGGRRADAWSHLDAAFAGGDARRWYPELRSLDPERALESLRRRADADGEDPDVWALLGSELRDRGRTAEARAALERASSLDPANREWARALRELR